MKQERVVRARPKKSASVEAADDIAVDDRDADLLSDIDELLDEIDSVLEDQLVLTSYRQRSGQ
jgi:hypothetical protein